MKNGSIKLDEIKWDPSIYPRKKPNTHTVERYADAMAAGEEFPAIVLEEKTNRLLDGRHRHLAAIESKATELPAVWHTVPEGVSVKLYAASLSARHGDRLSNADAKELALEEFETDPTRKASDWARWLGFQERTVQLWVSHITSRAHEERFAKALRLSMLGWTQKEIGEVLGITRGRIAQELLESEDLRFLTQIRELLATGLPHDDVARRFNLPDQMVYAIDMADDDDQTALNKLGVKVQPYDVWNFASCHDLMGDRHPGRIPGEIVAHVLYFYTKRGDLVIDPMAGSGTTLDACLLLGRKCYGYDIDGRHERPDILKHDLQAGWPDKLKKANLILWDPPYFDKMDATNIGDDGYIDGSISRLSREDYLEFLGERLAEAASKARKGCRLAFVMADWDPGPGDDREGIFVWDYADLISNAGWRLTRHIQAPLSTQQVHPDIVTKFRKSRRLARLERYVLIAEKQ